MYFYFKRCSPKQYNLYLATTLKIIKYINNNNENY